jgi:hypothetical protein
MRIRLRLRYCVSVMCEAHMYAMLARMHVPSQECRNTCQIRKKQSLEGRKQAHCVTVLHTRVGSATQQILNTTCKKLQQMHAFGIFEVVQAKGCIHAQTQACVAYTNLQGCYE